MKKYFSILLLVSFNIQAFVTWPGANPCDTTLQACIDGSVEGEYIEIRTNGPIDEGIFSNKVVSLVAGNGYKPVFSAFNSIQINSTNPGSFTLNVKGLTITEGQIMIRQFDGENTFNISNNHILANPDIGTSGLRVDNYSDNELILNMNYNILNTSFNTTLGIPQGAILIWKPNPNNGIISGQIFNNTIIADGIDSKGINITDESDTDINLNVTGNDISGGTQGGLFAHKAAGTGNMNLDIANNSFKREGNFYFPSGIHIINDTGATDVNIINNTMIESRWGILLEENGGSLTADVHNNLVAYCINGYNFKPGVIVNNDYNLYFQNSINTNYTPGLNSVNSNPLIKAKTIPRLHKGSPAEDAGNSLALLLLDGGTPFVDVDGTNRMKKDGTGSSVVDIGAYERGDISFNHTNIDSGSHTSLIDNENINSQPTLDSLHITSNWNPISSGSGVFNNHNEGLYYTGPNWHVFNQDISDLNTGASFSVMKYGATSNTFEHLASSAASNSSTIDQTGLNGNSDKILQVTQHWTNIYNPHPPGILYSSGNWRILNFDLETIPQNSNFNIYYQDQSKSAWEHIARTPNIFNHITYLDHPLLNGNHCAEVQVTQSASQGIFNDSPIGVYYEQIDQKWAIYNQDSVTLPENAAFHVIINPEQIADCSDIIFKNGFEQF